MFLRSVKVGPYEYLRLVESYREGTQVKQRIVLHVGRKDLLAPHLDSLVRLLQGDDPAPGWIPAQAVATPQAWSWGPTLVARQLFEELSLGAILDESRQVRHGQPLSERAFPLIANRLTRPGSEHALAQWLEDFYVINRAGSRWLPQWKQSRRVKVRFEQLRLWYQTLDDLLAEKQRIEKGVYLQVRDLFSLRPDLVFYDLTSTYFEGTGPAELGRFGYSRDQKPRKRQIVIGVVMMEGWPIAHHVFAGNRLDHITLQEVVQDFRQRFELNRVVWVGDRGMVTGEKIERLRQDQQGYVVGLQRRNRPAIYDYIQEAQARGQWEECPVGITAAEKAVVPQTRVCEVSGPRPGVRVLVVHSEERQQYERSMRERSMEQVRKELENLQRRVEEGELKEAEKIGAAAARILQRHHGHRYFGWELRKGKFNFFAHPGHFPRELALEGHYLIQTEEAALSPVEVVSAYKQLNEVERGFSQLKGLLQVRPVFHRNDDRVRGHVFVAALAFLLDRALEKKLRTAGSALSSAFSWEILETVRCVEIEAGHHCRLCVTRGSRHAAEVLRALGITQLDPPQPPDRRRTIM